MIRTNDGHNGEICRRKWAPEHEKELKIWLSFDNGDAGDDDDGGDDDAGDSDDDNDDDGSCFILLPCAVLLIIH